MKIIRGLKVGDLIEVNDAGAVMLLKYRKEDWYPIYTFIDAKTNKIIEQTKPSFDKMSCQDRITIVYRKGIRYRFHPKGWGPLLLNS